MIAGIGAYNGLRRRQQTLDRLCWSHYAATHQPASTAVHWFAANGMASRCL